MKKSQFERPEDYEASVPCFVLYFYPEEDQAHEDDDDPVARCFVKEYPDLTMQEFWEKYDKLVSLVNNVFENKFSACLNMVGMNCMLGYDLADPMYEMTYKECEKLFLELTDALEGKHIELPVLTDDEIWDKIDWVFRNDIIPLPYILVEAYTEPYNDQYVRLQMKGQSCTVKDVLHGKKALTEQELGEVKKQVFDEMSFQREIIQGINKGKCNIDDLPDGDDFDRIGRAAAKFLLPTFIDKVYADNPHEIFIYNKAKKDFVYVSSPCDDSGKRILGVYQDPDKENYPETYKNSKGFKQEKRQYDAMKNFIHQAERGELERLSDDERDF